MRKNFLKRFNRTLAGVLTVTLAAANAGSISFAQDKQETKEIVAGGYEIDMSDIPRVHFSQHEEWEELYNAAWDFHKGNIRKVSNGLNPELTNNEKTSYYVDEAFDNSIFQWDTLFMMMFDKYGISQFPTLNSMDNFYYHQVDSEGDDDGYICRRIGEGDGGFYYKNYMTVDAINPPLFGWAEWEQYKIHGDVSRFTHVIKGKPVVERLDSFFQFLKRTRRLKEGPMKDFYVSNGQGNGLDNTPNQDWGGWGQAANDMTIQQVQAADYIRMIAEEIVEKDTSLSEEDKVKYTELAEKYTIERDELKQLIQDKMWSEEGSFFFNSLASTGEFTNIVTPTGLWSLAANVATEKQADAMIDTYVLNSEKLFRPNGLSTVTYDYKTFKPTGGYWNGAMWSPTSYQWLKGLQQYGYDELAFQEAIRHITALSNVYQEGYKDRYGQFLNTLWENYSSEYTKPGSTENDDLQPSRTNFVGWTGALAIGSMIEDVAGVTVNAPENEINWNIKLTEEHGISNLYMNNAEQGENRVTLMAKERVSESSPVEITVTADKAFTLNVKHEDKEESIQVADGTHTYKLTGEDGEQGYLELAARDFENCGLSEAALKNAKDFVYFSDAENAEVIDGLKKQVRKAGLIYNVNTVGFRETSSKNPTTMRENDELQALGFDGAKDYVKKSHEHGEEGFMFMSPANNKMQTLKVLVGVQNATAEIEARISDASSEIVTQQLVGGAEEQVYVVEIPYRAASDGENVYVQYRITSDTDGKEGNISLKGALLEDEGTVLPKAPVNLTLTSQNKSLLANVEIPEGEEYDSYKIYVGTDAANLDDVRVVKNLPATVDNLNNYTKYYVAVSGVKDGAESRKTPTVSEIPEETAKTEAERAFWDYQKAKDIILNGNEDFEHIAKNLNFRVSGSVYGSTFEFISDTNEKEYGIRNNGAVAFPIGIDVPSELIVKVTYNQTTITIVEEALVIGKSVEEIPYVEGSKTITSGEVNLTEEGSKDWVQFNRNSVTEYAKKNGEAYIKNIEVLKGTNGTANDAKFTFAQTDAGAIKPSNNVGVVAKGEANGFVFDLPYSEKMQTAKVYTNVWGGEVTLECSVNGTVFYKAAFEKDTSSGLTGQCFEVKYKVPNENDKVTVKLYCSKNYDTQWGGCSDVLQAITLKETDEQIPEPEIPEMEDQDLNIAVAEQPAIVDITKEGAKDWLVFDDKDLTKIEQKKDTDILKDITVLKEVYRLDQGTGTTSFEYSDGTKKESATVNYNIVLNGKDNGIEFTAPYSTNRQRLKVYIGAWSDNVEMIATVKKGDEVVKQAVQNFDTGKQAGGTKAQYRAFDLSYKLNEGESLDVKLYSAECHDSTWGNFNIGAITLNEKYIVGAKETVNGQIEVGRKTAFAKDNVSVFVTPDEGYRLKENSLKYILSDGTEQQIDGAGFSMPADDVVITAEFEKIDKSIYIITVNGKAVAKGAYNTKVTVKAPAVEEKEFTGWLLKDKIVSTDENYTFYISEDMELTPCYEKMEVEPYAFLTNVILTKRADTKSDVKFVGQLAVPEGCTIENAGLIWSTKENTELTLGSGLTPTYIKAISNTNQFSVTIKGMPEGKFIRGRIFATIVDSEGTRTVVYSEEARR